MAASTQSARRAKIVCTLGPATATREALRGLVAAGMDVARFNLSHGSHAEHERVYRLVREVAAELGRPVGVMADLQGPKIRLGTFAAGPHELPAGARFCITTDDVEGSAERCSTTYAGLPGDVTAGDRILIDDGRVACGCCWWTAPTCTPRWSRAAWCPTTRG